MPATLQKYFQQILPLEKCDAEDGRVVGQLLVDLVNSNPKEKHAITIGSAISSSVYKAHALAAGLNKVIKSYGVLQAMKSEYAWFVPMLEVVMAHKAAPPRGSIVMKGLRSSISSAASSDAALHADAADEENGFSSVVRLGARGPVLLCEHWLVIPLGPRFAFQTALLGVRHVCHHRCLRRPKRARSQLPRLWSRLCMK